MTRNFRTLKSELYEKSGKQCAYCRVQLNDPLMASIDHFLPLSTHPHLAFDSANLLITCQACNMMKGGRFPLDENGNPLLLNPLTDNYSEHIVQNENGYLEGLTEQGKTTVSALQLNRTSLVEQRVLHVIEEEFSDTKALSEHDVYMTFKNNMQNAIKLNGVELHHDKNLKTQMAYMLFANVITSLETYLCDRFISLIQGNKGNLRNFVESFNDYTEEKFLLSEIFVRHEGIESKAIESMKSVLYHNLPKVSGMYRDTFGIKFPVFSEVFKSVLIRHDLVHRAEKTKDGNFHSITSDSVENVVNQCANLVEQLEAELRINT